MGRLDEALRRSDFDVARGVGALTPTPDASPWRFEPEEDRPLPEAMAPSAAGFGTQTVVGDQTVDGVGRRLPLSALDATASERLVVSADASPLLIEQFRSLAATLCSTQREGNLKSIVVTSGSPGDGKSHVAINLALTLSESYDRRVLLIDADLRRPMLQRLFRIPSGPGLSEALRGKPHLKLPLTRISEKLTLLAAGQPERDPLNILSSDRLKHLVADASTNFDWVIVDSPPVSVVAEGRLVSETVDGALLVVRAGVTPFPEVEAAADTIGRERILGIVLNGVEPSEFRGRHYYQHYYGVSDKENSLG